jgi:hypothetical protein
MSSTVYTSANTNFLSALFIQLHSRNKLLHYFGILNFMGAFICIVLSQTTETIVLGINAWIKPAKFFLSSGILSFTMAWYTVHLKKRKTVAVYNWVTIIAFAFELAVIVWQAANGRLSHFNTSSPLYSIVFLLMGIVITIFTLFTLYIGILFFRQQQYPLNLPPGYIWGIRTGIVLFVIFAFEGGQMAAQLAHTVGAPDGGEGWPVLNWSKQHGDLRVAHFFGMHSLQLISLCGYYFAKTKVNILLISFTWFVFVMLLYWQALTGNPVF